MKKRFFVFVKERKMKINEKKKKQKLVNFSEKTKNFKKKLRKKLIKVLLIILLTNSNKNKTTIY